jgi:hypothetical protein
MGATCARSPASDTLDRPDAGGRKAVSGSAFTDCRDEPRGAGWRRPPALPPMTWSMIGATPETPTESVSCAPAGPLWVDPLAAAAPASPPCGASPAPDVGAAPKSAPPLGLPAPASGALGTGSTPVCGPPCTSAPRSAALSSCSQGVRPPPPRPRRAFAPASAAEPTPPVAACIPSPKATSAPRPTSRGRGAGRTSRRECGVTACRPRSTPRPSSAHARTGCCRPARLAVGLPQCVRPQGRSR